MPAACMRLRSVPPAMISTGPRRDHRGAARPGSVEAFGAHPNFRRESSVANSLRRRFPVSVAPAAAPGLYETSLMAISFSLRSADVVNQRLAANRAEKIGRPASGSRSRSCRDPRTQQIELSNSMAEARAPLLANIICSRCVLVKLRRDRSRATEIAGAQCGRQPRRRRNAETDCAHAQRARIAPRDDDSNRTGPALNRHCE